MATPRAPHEHGRIRRPSPLSECGSAVTLTQHLHRGRPRVRCAKQEGDRLFDGAILRGGDRSRVGQEPQESLRGRPDTATAYAAVASSSFLRAANFRYMANWVAQARACRALISSALVK